MIETKEGHLETFLSKAISHAHAQNKGQLVSYTKKVSSIDPIQVFETAKHTKKDRVFWTSTAENFSLVGIGTAFEMTANKSRFEVTKKKWVQLLENAMIHNPYKVMGTGMITLGGMSFDPQKNKTKLWNKFEDSQFTIPEFTLTRYENINYFTITMQVNKDDDAEKLSNQLQNLEDQLLTQTVTLPKGARSIKKEEIAPKEWKEAVRLAREEIKEKEFNKIVLARELRLKLNKSAEISVMLNKLMKTQLNSYVFAFEHGEDCFIGATPERLVKIEGNQLLSTCLAGTSPRGKTVEEDQQLRKRLLDDKKNLEEHRYVVKMIKNKIQNYCVDVNIPDKPVIYPLKNLHHLYTPVSAVLKKEYTIFDVIQQLHPTPALGGVPREESLAFIREHELLERGWYGAPIGWLDSNHNGEFAVGIRSGLIQDDELSLFAGCGVMKDSNVEEEYEETKVKFLPMLSVLEDY